MSPMRLADEQAVQMSPAAPAPQREIQRQGGVAYEQRLLSSDHNPNLRARRAQDCVEIVVGDRCFAAFKCRMGSNQTKQSGAIIRACFTNDDRQGSYSPVAKAKPSSSHPVMPPAMIFTGRPSSAVDRRAKLTPSEG